MCMHATFIGAMLHCIPFLVNYSQEISDSLKILKFDAHVKESCTNISTNDAVLEYGDDVFTVSISLQSITGQYSGIRVSPNDARVVIKADTGELYEQLLHRV